MAASNHNHEERARQAIQALSFLMVDEALNEPRCSPVCSAKTDMESECPKLVDVVPHWVGETDDESDDENTNPDPVVLDSNQNVPSPSSPSMIEMLGPDLSSHILSHLDVYEICSVSLCSRSMYKAANLEDLWRCKFLSRWNTQPDRSRFWLSSKRPFWKTCYQNAHENIHDLWITHWNCVLPTDGDVPGRCCIPSDDIPRENVAKISRSPNGDGGVSSHRTRVQSQCPTCRHDPRLHRDGLPEVTSAIEAERKFSSNAENISASARCEEAKDPVIYAEAASVAYSQLHYEEPEQITRAQTIFVQTQFSIAKWTRKMGCQYGLSDLPSVKRRNASRESARAFQAASTFHREIKAPQYNSCGLNFLKDLLFFSAVPSSLGDHPSATKESERTHLINDIYDANDLDGTVPGKTGTIVGLDQPELETAHHTWHVVRFTNPDYVRPILFRIMAQRTECFTVYPSEGFLRPGETCQITFGVRMLGSMLSESFENLNVYREEVDQFLAEVYCHEAHLPYVPFAVRYMFAAVIPCVPPLLMTPDSRTISPLTPLEVGRGRKKVLDHLWENVATEADVRTIYLSAHVNANYSFHDLQRATLMPFDVCTLNNKCPPVPECTPVTFSSPNLEVKDPDLFRFLHGLDLEIEKSEAGENYRTEKRCEVCGRDWGPKSEKMAAAYLSRVLACETAGVAENRQVQNLSVLIRHLFSSIRGNELLSKLRTIDIEKGPDQAQAQVRLDSPLSHNTDMLPSVEFKVLNRIYQLLFHCHRFIVMKRANPLVTSQQQHILMSYDELVDDRCVTVQDLINEQLSQHPEICERLHLNLIKEGLESGGLKGLYALTSPWKTSGIYEFATSTKSVFRKPDAKSNITKFLDEPDYLNGFRYLCHSPGVYCLGRQEDPNHDDDSIFGDAAHDSRYYEEHSNRQSDIYRDSNLWAFAGALSIISDPRSLTVHGLYERIPYPGTLIRGPFLPDEFFIRHTKIKPSDFVMQEARHFLRQWKRVHKGGRFLVRSGSKKRRHLFSSEGRGSKTGMDSIDIGKSALCSQELRFAGTWDGVGEDSLFREISSMEGFLNDCPPPGVGRYSLSCITEQTSQSNGNRASGPSVSRLRLSMSNMDLQVDGSETNEVEVEGTEERAMPLGDAGPFGPGRGPRLFQIVWLISAHLGVTVDENHPFGSHMLDRRILIASQWVSNSLMVLPLLWTLLARFFLHVSTEPLSYTLEGLPYDMYKKMRFLTREECGVAALWVAALWLVMGRYAERNISRSYESNVVDQALTNDLDQIPKWSLRGFRHRYLFRVQQQWDKICPLFLQRLVFTPYWNRRTRKQVSKIVAAQRTRSRPERRGSFSAAVGSSVSPLTPNEEPLPLVQEAPPARKLLIGILVTLVSFISSSPHAAFNILIVICGSIGLGMSVSIQSMEIGREGATTRSVFRTIGVNTLVLGCLLIGQLVGCSGGILFLAEFVVMTVSLFLGGVGTGGINGGESWASFFGLSFTAFWGYLVARVALTEGIRRKQAGRTSYFLSTALFVILVLWAIILFVWKWDKPPDHMIIRSAGSSASHTLDAAEMLQ